MSDAVARSLFPENYAVAAGFMPVAKCRTSNVNGVYEIMRRLTLAIVLLPFLAGCAGGTGWVNPLLPKERWDEDLSACRHDADASLGPSAYVTPGEERTGNPMKLVDQTQNAKRFDSLVASCMASKGYRRAK
ncbi:MAG: hypothetical protein P4L94_04625 [Telmatospirillum sp.]|nr:hypothetical protein [Telmatospirillum sp.]